VLPERSEGQNYGVVRILSWRLKLLDKTKCSSCKRPILPDDDAYVCVKCGGRNNLNAAGEKSSGVIRAFFMCWLLDKPAPSTAMTKGKFGGRGDAYDQWSTCARCSGLIHRDTHMFGDGIWRHTEP